MINILLADAQMVVREGLKAMMTKTSNIRVVGEVEHGSELLDETKRTNPDVVVIDYSIPDFFEVDDLRKLKTEIPDINLLVISNDYSKNNVHQALEQGTNAFLLKECDKEEIVRAIAATAKKEKFFCNKVLDILVEKQLKKTEDDDCSATELSAREIEIVQHIGQGMTANEIADKLYLSAHTVRTHRKNIMRKLQVGSTAELIITAIKTSIIKSGSNE